MAPYSFFYFRQIQIASDKNFTLVVAHKTLKKMSYCINVKFIGEIIHMHISKLKKMDGSINFLFYRSINGQSSNTPNLMD